MGLFFVTIFSLFLFLSQDASANTHKKTIETFFSPPPNSIILSWDNNTRDISSETIKSWFRITNALHFHTASSETESISPGACPWNDHFCDFSMTAAMRFSIQTKTSFILEKHILEDFLENFQKETRIPPKNATFLTLEDGRASGFSPSKNGMELDKQASLSLFMENLVLGQKTISMSLPFITVQPIVSETNASLLGVTHLLGEGQTDFAGSPKNRVFNIHRALEEFQGVVVAPGEEFSFVKQLGEVDGEHGYLPELVIKQGRTEPEFGGGICQVSTTIFRAALNTGQKITERKNHAYAVSYYKPYGMDATIYIPKPDLKFVNNTSGHILIQADIKGSILRFQFYGTPDARVVTIDGPHILESNPDGSMKTIFTQKVTDASGAILIEKSFKSFYDSPDKYPHTNDEKLTKKPKNWSQKQWENYQKTGALPTR